MERINQFIGRTILVYARYGSGHLCYCCAALRI